MSKVICILGLGFLVGLFLAINGFLMAFYPDFFLKFYDWYTPGDYVAKQAGWRKAIHTLEFRIVGILIAGFGIFVAISLLRQMITGTFG
jgi:hypothetical protein